MQVDISKTTEVTCKECEGNLFEPRVKVLKLSALLSPTGKEAIFPLQVYVCSSCSTVMEDESIG